MSTVNFTRGLDSNYILIVDGVEFKTPLKKFFDIQLLMETINDHIDNFEQNHCVVNESSENPALGIIIDVYSDDTMENFVDSKIYLYDDFIDVPDMIVK
jgi:hypothetical protein